MISMMRVTVLLLAASLAWPLRAGQTWAPERIVAQALVNRIVEKYPDLLVVAMHVTPPNDSENVIIASNIGRNTYGIYTLDLKTGKRGNFAIENSNFDLVS